MNLFRKKEEVLINPRRGKKPKKLRKEKLSAMQAEPDSEESHYTDSFLPPDEPELTTAAGEEVPPTEQKPKPAKPAFYRSKLVIGSACVIAACLISFVLVPVMSYVTSTEMTTVVKAVVPIPKGTQVVAAMLQTISVPALNLGNGALREATPAVGKYAAVDIVVGDTLMSDKLTEVMPFPNDYLYRLPDGKQAISTAIQSFAGGLSGKLRAGDIVSIYAVLPQNTMDGKDYRAILPPELSYVQVLSVTDNRGLDRWDDTEQIMEEENRPATATLLVNTAQAATLAGLNVNGQLHVALVSRGNDSVAAQYLQSQEDYFNAQEAEESASDTAGSDLDDPSKTPQAESEVLPVA